MRVRDNIFSFITTLIIILVIIVTVALSLDLCGIITLPERISLRTYLPDSVQVVGIRK